MWKRKWGRRRRKRKKKMVVVEEKVRDGGGERGKEGGSCGREVGVGGGGRGRRWCKMWKRSWGQWRRKRKEKVLVMKEKVGVVI